MAALVWGEWTDVAALRRACLGPSLSQPVPHFLSSRTTASMRKPLSRPPWPCLCLRTEGTGRPPGPSLPASRDRAMLALCGPAPALECTLSARGSLHHCRWRGSPQDCHGPGETTVPLPSEDNRRCSWPSVAGFFGASGRVDVPLGLRQSDVCLSQSHDVLPV